MLNDLTLAIKHLRRSPLFVVVAVVTLGLGIGLTSTMLTMLDAVLHPYIPYRDVKQLYTISAYGDGGSSRVTAYEKNRALIENARLFDGFAGSAYGGTVLAEAYGNAEQIPTLHVTGNYFSLLGMRPEMGRFFADGPSAQEEDKAVVSLRFWRRVLVSRPLERGVNVTVDGRTYAVIGVMPPEVDWRVQGEVIFRTAGFAGGTEAQRRALGTIGRLKPGVSDTAAYAELGAIARRLTSMYGEGRQRFGFRLRTWNTQLRAVNDYQIAMAGAALAILLIVCGNLANLMVVRGLARRAEMALRLALGATRRDLIRQLFTEATLVGLLGGAAGATLAAWGVGVVRHRMPSEGRWIGSLMPQLDWRVFAFAAGATVLSVVIFGLWPAMTASDVSVSEPLKDAGTTTSSHGRRRYSVLVITEVSICLVLLMAAALMLRKLEIYNAYDPGYDQKGLVTGRLNLRTWKLAPDSVMHRVFADLRDRLRTISGVLEVATSGGGSTQQGAITSDFEDTIPRFINALGYQTVSPEYIRVMGYRIIRGRDFGPGDVSGPPLAIVDEYMGDRMWPGVDPVGRMIKLGGPMSKAPWVRVVGLMRSLRIVNRQGTPLTPGQLFVLDPRERPRNREVLARVNANSAVVGMAMRRTAAGMFAGGDWSGGYFWNQHEDEREALRPYMFLTGVFTSLGGLGLILASVGMYGVLAYAVGHRMREFGIRIALGAETQSVFRLVIHDAAVMILAGTAIGCWFAMLAGNLMIVEETSVIPPTDWIALAGSEAVLIGVCFVAAFTPAIRASRANPLDIIRAI